MSDAVNALHRTTSSTVVILKNTNKREEDWKSSLISFVRINPGTLPKSFSFPAPFFGLAAGRLMGMYCLDGGWVAFGFILVGRAPLQLLTSLFCPAAGLSSSGSPLQPISIPSVLSVRFHVVVIRTVSCLLAFHSPMVSLSACQGMLVVSKIPQRGLEMQMWEGTMCISSDKGGLNPWT